MLLIDKLTFCFVHCPRHASTTSTHMFDAWCCAVFCQQRLS